MKSPNKVFRVGIIGFGTVGTGLVSTLLDNAREIERRVGFPIRILRIADLDIARDRGVRVPPGVLSRDVDGLLDDPDIDVVVELIGGYEPARTYILRALKAGKHVVTANKALLARHGEEIFAVAAEMGAEVGFEASVGGTIPVIRAVKEGFAANVIEAVFGIVNGTANYILTKMTDEGRDFQAVLKEAQAQGLAEADPTFDVDGIDSAHKIAILANLCFGTPVNMEEILIEGIRRIEPVDIEFARELGYRVKLLVEAKRVDGSLDIRVCPTMLPEAHIISQVGGSFNAICIKGNKSDANVLIGRGAGSLPTGAAVAADIIEIARNQRLASARGAGARVPHLSYPPEGREKIPVRPFTEIITAYYLRCTVEDRPGVLSAISGILGRHDISIESVIQKGRREGGHVPLVMMTHEALEKDVQAALQEIDALGVVSAPTMLIRVESMGDQT
ncbi:MAG: homoserine dehydrogenase [Candidatus Tectomicrobia bacterium]|nr:homoserine dehydrogenase [Candidatus Tectomicrobia bacterium]